MTGSSPRFFARPRACAIRFSIPVLVRLQLRLASWTRRGFDTVDRGSGRSLPATDRIRCMPAISCCCTMATRRATPRRQPVILEVLPRLARRLDSCSGCGRHLALRVHEPHETLAARRVHRDQLHRHRHDGDFASLLAQRSGLASAATSRPWRSIPISARWPGSMRQRLPDGLARFRLPQQSAGGTGPAAGRLLRCGGAGGGALGPPPGRRFHRHQHRRHPADRTCLPRTRSGRAARCRRASITAPPTTRSRSPTTCGGACRLEGPAVAVSSRMRVQRQGIRLGAAHDRGRS